MKYNASNKPLVCMQTQSTCYKGTRKMEVKGVLWHSTGANNPNLKRYVQPSDTKPAEDTYDKEKWLEILGKNQYKNDWNHIERQAGLNCWIGKLADGTVTTVQAMPWDYRPWGCGAGKKGSCNNGWIQFEICEDALTDKAYFDKVYNEACEITAYLCKMFNIDPNGTVDYDGLTVPTILCHKDSYKLGLGSNHGDIDHWFPKHGKSMATARADVAAILKAAGASTPANKLYRVRKSKTDAASQKGAFSDLNNAKECCQKAGDGYHVFDWDYKIVYSYVAPEIPKEPEKVVAIYDLDYPEKTKIVDKAHVGTNANCTKAIKKILSNNSAFDIEIAKTFFRLAPRYKIDPMMAISQSILETGWFKYKGSAVTADQHNYCGLGVTSTGLKGNSFGTIDEGITAQLQHLFAYGCTEKLPDNEPILDPRFSLVTRGIAPYWQQLAGRWATGYDKSKYATPAEAMAAGDTYGQKIRTIYEQLCAVTVTEEEIQKYFPVAIEEPEADEKDITINDNTSNTDNAGSDQKLPEADVLIEEQTDDEKATALATLIFNVLKKLIVMIANLFSKGEK